MPTPPGAPRSLLVAPAHEPAALAAALASGADAVILDLAAAPTQQARIDGRATVARLLAGERAGKPSLLVGLGRLETPEVEADLDALAPHRPDAVVLAGAQGGEDVQRLGVKLAVREAEAGLGDGAIAVLALAAGSARAALRLSTYTEASRRLMGLAWSADALAADLGAQTLVGAFCADGRLTSPMRLARDLTLLAAVAAGAPAFDAAFPDPQDAEGLRRACARARRDGFAGKLAIHPDQVAVINAAFARAGA